MPGSGNMESSGVTNLLMPIAAGSIVTRTSSASASCLGMSGATVTSAKIVMVSPAAAFAGWRMTLTCGARPCARAVIGARRAYNDAPTMIPRHLPSFAIALYLTLAPAPSSLYDSVERYVLAHQQAIVGELVHLLTIPNVAADRENIRKNATVLQQTLSKRGFEAKLLETSGNPLVY